ncbi:putative ATP-dependent RNA helicase [Podosphaera aphanis]|nr:putative ATP-dependent RNA helicase [Podosphaera aphanis]
MAPKFVPRQRKHKVLARQKVAAGHVESSNDSNAAELPLIPRTEIQEKKLRLREELRNQNSKISSKKAKRLEKYIETKLRKDENRELISQLAKNKSDTSLYQRSSRLGQGKETKRQRLERALKDHQAGIDIDKDNEEVLFEERKIQDNKADNLSPCNEAPNNPLNPQISNSAPQTVDHLEVTFGAGLKRPLEVDKEGLPVLKKRKRRGGVTSKVSLLHESCASHDEPEWEGFSSASNMSDSETERAAPENYDDISDASDKDVEDFSQEEFEEEDAEDSSENFSEDQILDDNDEAQNSSRKQRSSAFKAWASQQINEALGYKPVSNICTTVPETAISSFKPRAPEQDPLPLELQPTSNTDRKVFSVTVERPPGIQEMRLKLPVVAEEQKIMEAVHNNNIVVICGATGSGKTTQIPQFLFESGYGSPDSLTPGMIGITQPRRVAAVSMAKRVGDEMGEHRKKVAYQIRFEATISSETAIKFMTDGVLLREVTQDIALRKYSAIIIDEAHERSVNTDILIGMLSRVVKLRAEMSTEDPAIKPLKLIIMSATLRITDFTLNKTLFTTPPPVIQAEGRQHTVTCHFARKTYHDYVEEAFKKISKGHKKLPPGGFLVFLTGQNEIAQLTKRLKEALYIDDTGSGPKVKISGRDAPVEAEDLDFGEAVDCHEESDDDDENDDLIDISLADDDFEVEADAEAGPAKMHILPLYSLLPTKEQLRVFEIPPDGSRLIVLATNVAETSVTIPGIRYVFDCGRSKERKYDSVTGVQTFEIGWISKASAEQRAGRAGRTGPGHCYRLYSSAVYERDFQQFAEPEILRMPIEGLVLQLKAMNLHHVVNFPFPTPPDRHMLANSEKVLTYLSAISETGKITSMGSTMSLFPLSPRFSRILLVGHLHDCLPYTIALVAGLSAPDVFLPENQIFPTITQQQSTFLSNSERIEEDLRQNTLRQFNRVHRNFCFLDDKSDAIKLLQVVGEFAHEPTEAWCQEHFVRFKTLREITQLQRQITELFRINIPAFAALKFEEKLNPPSARQVKMLKQMVAAGFIDHVAIRADMSPNPPEMQRKPSRAINVPYLTLFPSHVGGDEAESSVFIHPASPLAHLSPRECPEYIIYSHLQRQASSGLDTGKIAKTRMHALTDLTGNQVAALAKGTPLIHYGKPLKKTTEITPNGDVREAWVIPYLRPTGTGSMGWPLPARKVTQKKVPGRGWIVD